MEKYNKTISLLFFAFTVLFLLVMLNNESFFNWAFARHQNQVSWYIRPLFLVPFCFFAYHKNLAGISITLFAMLTSMFWFPEPSEPNAEVSEFLNMEKEWLKGSWNSQKTLMNLLVPVSLTFLAAAFWKRSVWLGFGVLMLIAVGKVVWSVIYGGESGKSILVPAVTGLVLCIVLIYWRLNKAGSSKPPKKKKA